MAKKYKVKDINNNGKIDGWEQGKYDAINKSATKMGYSMKMGDKENYSPTNFKTKDALNISAMPMTHHDDPNKIIIGPEARKKRTSNLSKLGGESRVGQTVNGKTITFDPTDNDLGFFGKLANRLEWHGAGSQSRSGDVLSNIRERGSGAKKGDVNRYGETYIGFNFMPPKNKIEGPTIKSGMYQYDRPAKFGFQKTAGDTVFNDSNQDGTRLGRSISRFINRGSGVGR